MRAFLHDRYGRPAEVIHMRETDVPTLVEDRVLVRVRAASINAYDWHLVQADPFLVRIGGMGLFKPKHPRVGADFAGVVEEVGSGVSDFAEGDRVFGTLSPLHDGAFAEYALASPRFLAKMPPSATFAEAAAIPMAALTALQGLRDTGGLETGQKVAINGASGGVGSYAVQFAKWMGAHVTAICSTKKLELARSLGADRVIDYTQDDFTRLGDRYDLIFAVNGYQHLEDYRRALAPDGTYVMAGGTNRQILQGMLRGPFMNRRTAQRLTTLIEKPNAEDLRLVARLFEEGTVRSVIDRTFPFEQTPQAVAYVADGHAGGKVIVDVEEANAAR